MQLVQPLPEKPVDIIGDIHVALKIGILLAL